MEYDLQLWCEDCTKKEREAGNRYHTEYFYSLTNAVHHIMQTGHDVHIELETKSNEDD